MSSLRFNGSDYQHSRDGARLERQLIRIWKCMKDKKWRTLGQIADKTGDPTPSISAQLRHLRKPRFGKHTVNKRYLGSGLFEYQLIPRRGV